MKYSNGFTINATNNEVFISFVQTRPNGEAKHTEEAETLVMTERTARQLAAALQKLFEKVDSDRASKKTVEVNESSQLS